MIKSQEPAYFSQKDANEDGGLLQDHLADFQACLVDFLHFVVSIFVFASGANADQRAR